MVQVQNVNFNYGDIRALADVTQAFASGDFIAIIGRNGSGKSTLSRCMAGFLKPASGRILVYDTEIHKLRPRERVQRIGYVFQNPDHQIFRETVTEEVLFGLNNIRVPAEEAVNRARRILDLLELDSKRHVHPFRLARGDRQRLAIASVAVLEPRVLIVDEPTTGQDPVRAREIMDLLKNLNKVKGTTIIVVTHAMDLVAEYASTIVAMSEGRVLLNGGTRQVFEQVARMVRSPIPLPPVVRLGVKLGLAPLPLTVDELVAAQ